MDKKELRHIYAEKKIRESIRHLNINDKLPGERTFSTELGISYMTTRRAIDNLVKGAAGGAMQWMNRLWDLPQTSGLDAPAPGWT